MCLIPAAAGLFGKGAQRTAVGGALGGVSGAVLANVLKKKGKGSKGNDSPGFSTSGSLTPGVTGPAPGGM